MRQIISVVFATILVSMALPAHAVTGSQLKACCADYDDEKNKGFFSSGFCAGYITGTIESIAIWTAGSSHIPYCLPENATNDQIISVIRKYLDANPEKLHLDGAELIIDAISDAFPCKCE